MHWISITQLFSPLGRNERRAVNSATSLTATILVWCLLSLTEVCSLEIKELKVPTGIATGSGTVTLDCDYVYDDREKNNIVVKWFRETGPSDNKTSQQVYQWITSLQPQDLGVLKGRLNILYEASDDPQSKHRALNIIQPTVNLSGDYRCHVSSNYHDAVKSQKMVIYSPPTTMDLKHDRVYGSKVNVSCSAKGIYPEPSAEIKITTQKRTDDVISDATQLITPQDGLYDITVYKLFDAASLQPETQFACLLTVPETTYSLRKSFIYYPQIDTNSKPEADSANSRLSNKNRESSLTDTQPASDAISALTLYHRHAGHSLVLLANIALPILWTLVV